MAPGARPFRMLPARLLPLLRTPLRLLPRLASSTPMAGEKPVEVSIRSKLQRELEPSQLEVHNESHQHAVPPGAETHFKVVIASSRFAGLPLLQRHRLVNEILQAELAGPVHALSIHAKTPEQWDQNASVSRSPACLGGSKHDPHMAEKLGSQG
ncbi:bolA-like protein 1 isoform X1 [Alligator sinensis]|uniref:BolA-like protein 1 n=2 Tax=Alligator sinensis TaxID=38654 RepID=A0A3Q0HKJ5_ALLSI|nr:bolA-like protein 1 isoform X1 [Alligator sinensis]